MGGKIKAFPGSAESHGVSHLKMHIVMYTIKLLSGKEVLSFPLSCLAPWRDC